MYTAKGKYVHILHPLLDTKGCELSELSTPCSSPAPNPFLLSSWSPFGPGSADGARVPLVCRFAALFICNSVLQCDVHLGICADREHTAQWNFTNQRSTGRCPDRQVKSGLWVAPWRAHFWLRGCLCTPCSPAPTPFAVLISDRKNCFCLVSYTLLF